MLKNISIHTVDTKLLVAKLRITSGLKIPTVTEVFFPILKVMDSMRINHEYLILGHFFDENHSYLLYSPF